MTATSARELAQARKEADVRSIALSDGVTAYDVAGDVGPWVVLAHGIFTPMITWDRLVPRLVDAGMRVLRHDAYGRGFSDRPRIAYDAALFVRQLRELLDGQGIARAHLVGWSMGGATCTRFFAEHPTRVGRMALIAPALLLRRPRALDVLLRTPLRDAVLDRISGLLTRGAAHSQLASPRKHREYVARMHEQRRFPGLGHALASTLEHFPWDYGRALPAHVRESPTLLVWGRHDSTVPFRRAREVASLFTRVHTCVLDHARHGPHYDHAEDVARALRSAFAGDRTP